MSWVHLIGLTVSLVALIAIIAILSENVLNPLIKLLLGGRGALSHDDRDRMDSLQKVAARTEERLHTLECILDAEAPGWRERH